MTRRDEDEEPGKDAGHDPERERQRVRQRIRYERRGRQHAGQGEGHDSGVARPCRDRRPDGDEDADGHEERGHGTAGLGLASPFPTGAGYVGVGRIPNVDSGQ